MGEGHTQILVHPWVGILNPGKNAELFLSMFLLGEEDHGPEEHIEKAQEIPGFEALRWIGQTSFWGAWWASHSWKLDRSPEKSKIYTYSHIPVRLMKTVEELWGANNAFLEALQAPRRLLRTMHLPSKFHLQLSYPLFT